MKSNLQPTLNWDIRMEPVTVNNSFDTGKKAIIRNDNNKLLGIVGKHYKPVTNAKLLYFTDALTESGEFKLMGFDELKEGKVTMAFLKNMNPNLKINGCTNDEFMFIGNSFDGTQRFHIGTGSSLHRCLNQFYSTLEIFSKKHTSFIDNTNFVVADIIKKYKTEKGILYESFDGMQTIRVDESVVASLIKEVHLMLANDSRAVMEKDWTASPSMQTLKKAIEREMKDLGNNAFGLFNGVTWYTTHEMRSLDSHYSGVNGTANLINQKAFSFCKNLKTIHSSNPNN
jgi:hypothetical protein